MRSLYIVLVIALLSFAHNLQAQTLLGKKVSVNAKDKTIEHILNDISKQGGFYFSYNSKIISADSSISLYANNKPISYILNMMFGNKFELKESKNHIIIQQPNNGQYWEISGYIIDEETGQRVRDVSIFEPNELVACMSNKDGYFQLKLKDKTYSSKLNISKSWYNDTTITIKPGINQQVRIAISPRVFVMDSMVITDQHKVEGTWFGKFFLSSKQRMQSLNLNRFFVEVPVQASLTPGLSSQGKMSAQMVNSASLNLLGGYSAGVNGAEFGGGFNIVKKDVKYFQAAGIFNVVGGKVSGFQGAGIYNTVLDTVVGVQVAGISNVTKGRVDGLQAAGIYNLAVGGVQGSQFSGMINTTMDSIIGIQAAGLTNLCTKDILGTQMAGIGNATKSIRGLQAAGIINIAAKNVSGMQFSGLINLCGGTMKGMQAGEILNFARNLKGVQFGLINIADSSSGVSIGIFSFVRRGYHKISFSANEILPTNVSLKTGSHWLYNIYSLGVNPDNKNKAYMYGFGWGSELPVIKNFTINPEATGHLLYLGNWNDINVVGKLSINLNYRINKYLAVFAGPAFTMYYDNQQTLHENYKTNIPQANYKKNHLEDNVYSWVGWNAGITIF